MSIQEQDCPLCAKPSAYTIETVDGKQIKKITCPQCKKLEFEEGTEDLTLSSSPERKKELITMAVETTGNQRLRFSIAKGIQTDKGRPFIDANVI